MADSQQAGRPIVYRGAKEICRAVGLDYKQMAVYVRDYGLPAFKVQKSWLAVPADLEAWVLKQRDKHFKRVDG